MGSVLAATLLFVAYQGVTQEALPQAEAGADPTFQEGSGGAFAPGEIIVALE